MWVCVGVRGGGGEGGYTGKAVNIKRIMTIQNFLFFLRPRGGGGGGVMANT